MESCAHLKLSYKAIRWAALLSKAMPYFAFSTYLFNTALPNFKPKTDICSHTWKKMILIHTALIFQSKLQMPDSSRTEKRCSRPYPQGAWFSQCWWRLLFLPWKMYALYATLSSCICMCVCIHSLEHSFYGSEVKNMLWARKHCWVSLYMLFFRRTKTQAFLTENCKPLVLCWFLEQQHLP